MTRPIFPKEEKPLNKNQKKKPRGAGIYILLLMVVMGVLAILLEEQHKRFPVGRMKTFDL